MINVMTDQRAVQLVDEVQGVIRAYVHVWNRPGEHDSYGTWFDKENPPELALDFAPFILHYEHANDGVIRTDIIGKIDKVWFDEVGLRFEAQLYKDRPYFDQVIAEIRGGLLKTSSATAPHTAAFDEENRFTNWELFEVSLTKTPSESRMPAVELLRSATWERDATSAGSLPVLPLPLVQEVTTVTTPNPAPNPSPKREGEVPPVPPPMPDLSVVLQDLVSQGFSLEEIMAALQQLMSAGESAPPSMESLSTLSQNRQAFAQQLMNQMQITRSATQLAQITAERDRLLAERNAPPTSSTRSANPSSPQIYVSEPNKYWSRSTADLMFAHEILKARKERPSEDFLRTLAGRTEKHLEKHDALIDNPAVRSILKGTRADEIVTSTNSGNGDEWIGVAYSSTLWEKARNNRIYQQLVSKGMVVEEVPQGMESTIIFTEGADPTVYTITQSADLDATLRPTVVVPVTAPGTGQVTLTPGYLGMAVAYTSVFEEDSLIAASTQLNNQMNEKAEETVEQLMINGDTASSVNINYDDGTANSGQYFLASNGMRKYALVTGSSTSRSGGALDEDDFRLTLKLFPSAIRTRRDQIAFVIDSDLHNTALTIPAIKTRDVSSAATLEAGVLTRIWGVDVMESGLMLLTASDGKITYNAGGTLGQILAVYAPYWAMGWKRRVTFETAKDILAQSNLIVATFRLGFIPRGAGAAVETYNLTIA